jgi:3',5'-nucleoside bisphosphate phosphatase
LTVEEGAALGRATGARVSLAHPHTVGHPMVVRALCERAREAGLEGIEAYYGPYATRERAEWMALGESLGMVITAGSDFHGRNTPDIPGLGVELPEPQWRRLAEWLGPLLPS